MLYITTMNIILDIYVAIFISRLSRSRRDDARRSFRFTRVNSVNRESRCKRLGSNVDVDGGGGGGGGVARCNGLARRGAASEVPLLENVERSARLLPFYEEGSLFHFHGSSTARRGAPRRVLRSSSVSASEAAPVPVAAVPVVALLCRSQLEARHILGGFTPPHGTTAVTNVSCSRGGHTHATHTRTDDASPRRRRRRTHAARRRRGRRRRGARDRRIVPKKPEECRESRRW